jgi:hypothetical protein
MSDLQEIYDEIGKLLVGAAPPDAATMIFEGKDYDAHAEGGPYWIRHDGTEGRFTRHHAPPRGTEGAVMDLVRRLKAVEPFASDQPFTHYRIALTDKMKFSIDFAHIPQEQSWARVFMRPVGGLSEEEADALLVPKEHWQLRKRLHDGDITKAEFDAELAVIDAAFDARKAQRG